MSAVATEVRPKYPMVTVTPDDIACEHCGESGSFRIITARANKQFVKHPNVGACSAHLSDAIFEVGRSIALEYAEHVAETQA